MRSEHIAVAGAGQIGRGIAQIFAARGHEIVLFDPNEDVLEKAIEKIRSNLIVLSEHGHCLREDIKRTIERIRPVGSLKEAVASARFVVESVSEKLEVKQDLFHEMEAFCSPIAILATNTSAVSVTDIAAKIKFKERVVGIHFWPPPHLVPLVEVVGGQKTSQEVKEYTCNILKSVGKHPVMMKRDVPGLVGNRLLRALRREAITIVEQGIAVPRAVDDVVKKGLSICLSIFGPLENTDLDGADPTSKLHEHLYKFVE